MKVETIFLRKLSLKFCNQSIEKEFLEATRENKRSHNIWISLICSILAFATTILYTMQFYHVKEEGRKDNLKIEKISNNTLIDLINKNLSSISPMYIIKNKYILINGTRLILGYKKEESLIISSLDSISYVNSYNFLNISMCSSGTTLIFYLIFLIWALKTRNDKYHNFIFFMAKFLFSQSFHTISGSMIVHFKFNAENVYFIIAMQLLLIILLVYSFHVSWILFFWSTLFSNISEWLIYNSIVSLSNPVLLYYLITNSLIHFNCVLISYMKEKKFRSEFYVHRMNNKQRKHAVELIYKMDQGFISYNKDNNSLFFNDSMKNILNSFKEKDTIFEEENVSEILNNKKKLSKDLIGPRLTSVNEEFITVKQNNIKEKKQQVYFDKNPDYYNSFLLESNVRPEGKSLIERLLKNSINLNNRLPDEIQMLFNGSQENILDIIYEKVKNDDLFSSFTYLGVIKIKHETNQNIKDYNDYNKKFSLKYQILFRVVSYDIQESYLEFMFQDVSEVVQLEMEKAILNTRSLYLSKIAHEFKNPICSILDLTSDVKQISREKEENFQDKIISKVNYIKDLCGVMSQFLNDYILFTNLKFSCDNNCGLNILKLPSVNNYGSCDFLIGNQNMQTIDTCLTCSSISPLYCKKCKICKTCEDYDKIILNSMDLINKINENFRKLYKSEKGENLPKAFSENFLNFCVDIRRENPHDSNLINRDKTCKLNYSLIKANKKLLESALYNLIFYSYRSTYSTKGETNVLVTTTNFFNCEKDEIIRTKFEIFNQNLQINPCFVEFLKNSNRNDPLNKAENLYDHSSNIDEFNKYFELYVAFNFIKKLGSELSISCREDGTFLSFTIDTKKSDIENYSSLNEDSFQPGSSEEELDQTIQISFSRNLLKRPSNVQLINRSCSYFMTTKSKYHHPKIVFLEEQNEKIEIELKNQVKQVRVLLIDDEPLIRKSLKKHLVNISKHNETTFLCEEASNCFEAIDIVYQNFLNKKNFDIIIIDEYMPFMKGSTFIKLFKQLYQENNFYHIKIISYTAFDCEEKKKLILNSGADKIINKPISYNDIKKVILSLI